MALKILLADDSMTAQNMGKKILVDAGYEVVAVSNGAAAIKKISSERPDIAILDEYMPGYTGSEVCERVKASTETSKIPVLLTVGKMEPFDQDKANKVRADGVMIKPFEASDLIAAVQSIAQRLLAPTAPARIMHDNTVQLRAGAAGYEDTLRVPPPKLTEPDHEDTLRLTAEQIKAFQDASYHDWAKTAERQGDDEEKAAAQQATEEIAVTPAVSEASVTEAAPPTEESAPAMPMTETSSAARETPVFSAMAASGVAAEHEIFAAAQAPIAPVEEAAPFTPPAFYTPPVLEPTEETESPAFAIQPEAPAEPVSPVMEEMPAATILEPVVETGPGTPVAEAAPVLETSAPLTPGPMPVEQAADLEPTSAPVEEVTVSEAHELEVNSPPQELGGAAIVQEAALITEADDMSQFVTKFGVENAEPVHVGVVSDLSQEQLAAIVSPVEEEEAPTAPESLTGDVGESEEVTPAVVEEPQTEAVVPVEVAPVIVEDSVEDTQGITVQTEPVLAPVEEVEAADVPAEAESVSAIGITTTSEPSVESEAPVMAAPVVDDVVAAAVEVPVAESEQPGVAEVTAEPVQVQPTVEEAHALVAHVAEVALAAAAGGTVVSMPQMGVAEPAIVQQPVASREPSVQEAPEPETSQPQAEAFGDAALAEELAAALSRKEAEERAKAAVEAATAAALEPAAAAAIAPVRDMGMQSLSDTKLADAVARAFENLKPQLITEIIKELGK